MHVRILIDEFSLAKDDPALANLAQIVHAVDISSDRDTYPFGAAIEAIGAGGLDAEADDHRLLERSSFIYDALYEWCLKHD